MTFDLTTLRVVIVDDDRLMLRLLVHQLGRLGIRNVVPFDSGVDAIKYLTTASSVDLLFLDINMPQMDGVEVLRRLALGEFAGSIVLISGEGEQIISGVERLLVAHQLVPLGRLRKPVNLEQLRALVDRWRPRGTSDVPVVRPPKTYDVRQLRTAIVRNELICHYQPKVALDTGRVVGAECLVRWQHPTDGLIFPDRFIPIAEEHDLISQVTYAVLRSAMRQASVWAHSGLYLPIAVNVSMADISGLEFPDIVTSLAEDAGVDPSLITLEVTESRISRTLSTALDVLTRLRLKRFRLAIDDFGTGHSSLAQLRDLPFDELKIDRGFVHGAAQDERLRAICSASIRMAEHLKMNVVAEGIEDEQDWHTLMGLGCRHGQGYFISRPLAAEKLPGWLADWTESHVGERHRCG
ncbi:MAG: EAL domain-containing response regulator [Gemmatimonadaceae bacterium]